MSETTLDTVLRSRLKEHEVVDVDEPTVKLVVFALGGQWFAFPGERIREILDRAAVYFVPGCPPALEGVINVRGAIESVIRPHDMLRIAPAGQAPRSSILLGNGGGITSGIRVDQVVDVVDVARGAVQPPPTTLDEPLRGATLGVLRLEDRPVAVLDIDALFTAFAKGLG